MFAHTTARAVAEHTGHVHLGRRLGEREIRRPQPHAQVLLEERLQELLQCRLEVGKADVLIDHEPLDLMEHGRVGHVVIAAIHPPWHDHGQRQAPLAQLADLHGRGVRAQQSTVREIERVVHGAGRMVGRNIERLEIMEVVLDLGARGHLEPGVAKQGFDTQARPRDGMNGTARLAATGQRHVETPRRKLRLDGLARQRLACSL